MPAQQLPASVDSLQALLRQHPEPDTLQLNLLIALARKLSDADTAQEMLEKATRLAIQLKRPDRLGECQLLSGYTLLSAGRDSLAAVSFEAARNSFSKPLAKEGLAKAFIGLGRVAQYQANYSQSIQFNEQALPLFKEVGNTTLTGTCYLNNGNNYYYLSDYARANENYQQALNYYEKAGRDLESAIATANIAMINKAQQKYTTAITYYRKAMAIQLRINDSVALSKSLQGIGITYDLMGNSDSAIWYYRQSLAINEKKGLKLNIAENMSNLGITYKDIGQYSLAYQHYVKALELFSQLNHPASLAQVQISLAELYRSAPDSFFNVHTLPAARRYPEAINLLKESIRHSSESGELDTEQHGWQALSQVYAQQGNYKAGLDALNRSIVLKDSIVNAEQIEQTTRQNTQAEFARKEAVTQANYQARLQQEKTLTYAALGGIALLLVGGGVSFAFYKRKRDALAKQQAAELQAEISDTEMKALRAQMNPHFIFNSLNSISDFISNNNTRLADEYLSRFSRLMRMILENSEKKEVALANDLNALELYMELEALRLRNKFSYRIEVDPQLDAENLLVPPLLLQPFVENSIWHGIAPKTGNGHILIRIYAQGDMIHCTVEDDGVGRQHKPGKSRQQTSLGMKITASRISQLNRQKKKKASVQVHDLAQGLRVELHLPLELMF